MKVLIAMIAALSLNVMAADFPELYCVSSKSFENVNQINVFTNKKGTMRINLQFYAVSEDGGDAGNFDTDMLQTIVKLKYDSKTGIIGNGANKVEFQVEEDSITPKQADAIFAKNANNVGFDFENPSGHKAYFKKYYLAKMLTYNLPGKKGLWTESLMNAFKAGVTDYVCGNRVDLKGRVPSIFDDNGDD